MDGFLIFAVLFSVTVDTFRPAMFHRFHIQTGKIPMINIKQIKTTNNQYFTNFPLMLHSNIEAKTAGITIPLSLSCYGEVSSSSIMPSSEGSSSECGNGIIEESEVCDGTSLNGETCVSQGYDSGTLACSSDCSSFDVSDFSSEGSLDGSSDSDSSEDNSNNYK